MASIIIIILGVENILMFSSNFRALISKFMSRWALLVIDYTVLIIVKFIDFALCEFKKC